jgi:hypothetical protein
MGNTIYRQFVPSKMVMVAPHKSEDYTDTIHHSVSTPVETPLMNSVYTEMSPDFKSKLDNTPSSSNNTQSNEYDISINELAKEDIYSHIGIMVHKRDIKESSAEIEIIVHPANHTDNYTTQIEIVVHQREPTTHIVYHAEPATVTKTIISEPSTQTEANGHQNVLKSEPSTQTEANGHQNVLKSEPSTQTDANGHQNVLKSEPTTQTEANEHQNVLKSESTQMEMEAQMEHPIVYEKDEMFKNINIMNIPNIPNIPNNYVEDKPQNKKSKRKHHKKHIQL